MADQTLTIVAVQIDFRVGDIRGNVERIIAAMRRHADADLVVTSECSVTGYPVEDLVFRPDFLAEVAAGLDAIQAEAARGGPAVLVGAPVRIDGSIRNAAFLFDGAASHRIDKHQLPNYGPFDEKRNFRAGTPPLPVPCRGFRLGVLICEDLWCPEGAAALGRAGAEALVVINGSPMESGKDAVRKGVARDRQRDAPVPLLYVNQIGGQDELVFDGGSFALRRDGTLAGQLAAFAEDAMTFVLRRGSDGGGTDIEAVADDRARAPHPTGEEEIYRALVLGLRDYVDKNGFPGVVLGVSGGIDSALSAALAVDALGPERVWGVMMPYRYTSAESLDEARAVTANLGIRYTVIALERVVAGFQAEIADALGAPPAGLALENLQARARGTVLMTLSNQTGHMVLSTGNKSEISVGYATLYGDMCGGFNALKDVYKTHVYALARWRNAHRPRGGLGPEGVCIPPGTITREPSAELAPGQKDSQSLPDYAVLDAICESLVDRWESPDALVARGFDRAVVWRIAALIDRAEYKRRQGAPGIKVSRCIFGKDRRVPITNGAIERG